MTENYTCFSKNEINSNAKSGTELMMQRLDNIIDKNLQQHFQVIPSRFRGFEEDKIRIFWAHDLATDPEVQQLKDPNFRNKFHKIVFTSDWQYQQYQLFLGLPYDDKSIVIPNAIVPIEVDYNQKSTDTIRICYISTPHRGLAILVPVFEELSKKYDNIELDVFSSFNIYGWSERDKEFEPIYDKIRQHPKMNYHGTVSNDEIREYLKTSHILGYSNIYPETFCISLVEALSAGLSAVHPDFAALPETGFGLTAQYQGHQDPQKHAGIFYGALEAMINAWQENRENVINYNTFIKSIVDYKYNINRSGAIWTAMMNSLLEEFPTKESRRFSKSFIYSTT